MIHFSKQAWSDYTYWQLEDSKIIDKINGLVKDILRNPFNGIGKPEPLRANLKGYWSRRITHEHRIVYKFINDEVFILSCRFHYS